MTTEKRARRSYTLDFKRDAVALVTEQIWAFAATKNFPVKPLLNVPDIKTLRTRLRRSGLFYSEAYTRLKTYAGQ